MARVLLVDDDEELVELLRDYLIGEGFTVDCAGDGETGVRKAIGDAHDIAVLDVTLPGINGIEALRRIRAASAVPVLMLTARGDDWDRISGLELGADDYVPKPCTPRELAARLRAILKRTGGNGAPGTAPRVEAGELTILPGERRALRNGVTLELTSTEFNLLEILARNAGRVVGKAELSEQALGRPLTRFDRAIDVHMSSIRQKIGSRADGRSYIQTVIRKGYQFIA